MSFNVTLLHNNMGKEESVSGVWFITPCVSAPLLQKSEVPPDYDKHDPEQKQIYRFVRTLFSAAQLTAECAIVTLVSPATGCWIHPGGL